MKIVDLHTHSFFSDGTLSPARLVRLAAQRGVEVLALTDHDTTDGLDEFLRACCQFEIIGVPGVELSAEAPYTLHILGYQICADAAMMKENLEFVRQRRIERNEKMCRRLKELGVPVSLEEAAREAGTELIARPHFARVLVRKGYAPDIRSAFRRYLGDGAPGDVPKVRLSPRQCIATIRDAGGVAVLAHPAQTGLDEIKFRELLCELKAMGLWGLECFSSHHDSEAIFRFLELARDFGLHPTAGSDFHGGNRPGVDLGLPVREGFLEPFLLDPGSA